MRSLSVVDVGCSSQVCASGCCDRKYNGLNFKVAESYCSWCRNVIEPLKAVGLLWSTKGRIVPWGAGRMKGLERRGTRRRNGHALAPPDRMQSAPSVSLSHLIS